jgi:hypothetical protein
MVYASAIEELLEDKGKRESGFAFELIPPSQFLVPDRTTIKG